MPAAKVVAAAPAPCSAGVDFELAEQLIPGIPASAGTTVDSEDDSHSQPQQPAQVEAAAAVTLVPIVNVTTVIEQLTHLDAATVTFSARQPLASAGAVKRPKSTQPRATAGAVAAAQRLRLPAAVKLEQELSVTLILAVVRLTPG